MAGIREQAMALWNEVEMQEDADAKADSLKRMMELVLESSLLPEFVPCLLELRDDPGSVVRENVAEMIEGVCLQSIGYVQIIAPSLLALSQDSEPAVVQRAIISGSNIFETVFKKVAVQGVESGRVEEDLLECWNWMIRFKEAISSLAFKPGNDDVRLLALKFLETTILLFTPESKNPLPVQQTSDGINLIWRAGGHPVFDANTLEQEAFKNLGLLLNQLQTPEAPTLTSVVAFAVINSLTGISERRPYMSETILPVLSALVPNSEPVPIQELKGVSLNILASNQAGALPWREQLVASLRPMNVKETGNLISREPGTSTASSASDTRPSMNVEETIDQQIVKEPGTPTSASSASETITGDQIIKEPGTPTSVSSASDTKVTRPSITSRTALKPRTIVTPPPRTALKPRTIVPLPPRTASPLRQIRTSSPATTVTAPPRTASPARQTRTSPAAASVGTAPPRTASPARGAGTSSATSSVVTASPRTASPARQTRVATSENASPRSASPSRQTRTPVPTTVNAPPRTASPSRQPRTSSTTGAMMVSKTSGSIPQNGLAGGKLLRGLSPSRARSVDNAVSRVSSSSPRTGIPSVENPKSYSVIVPFPPVSSVKSVKPALTSLKVSPRPSPSPSSSPPRAATSAVNPRASGVVVPFPLTALKSMPKPSVITPRPAPPSVKPAPRSASPSVKGRPASPSLKPPASLSVKTSTQPASPSVKTPTRPASPSARATIGTSPRTDSVNVASRPASPARKSLAASPSQPPYSSPRASGSQSPQLSSTSSGSVIGPSPSSRAGLGFNKPSASTNSVAVASLISPATSARSMLSPGSSSQSLLKSKVGSLTPSTRRGAQLPSCESPQNLSSGRSDVHSDSVDAIAARSVVQEVPTQRLRIASFKRSGSGLSKATEIVSPEVPPAHPMNLSTKKRCGWITSQSDDGHIAYHDNEWGIPVYDDKLLFELIVLQGAQAELSWPTILARRNNFRGVFANFDPAIVAKFDEKKKLSLIADSSICFPEAKVRGAVDNAALVLKIIEEYGSLSKFLWSYVNHKPIVSQYKLAKQVPVKTPKAEALSKELLRRGFRFVGPTTMYSVMQAAGLVCDHLVTCYKYQESSAESSPVTELEEEKIAADSWQRISLPEWRASTIEAVDAYPLEFRRASSNASDPVWAELPIIEEAREDDMEKNSDDDEEEYDDISTSSKCEIPVF